SATARISTWRLTPRTVWSLCRTTYSTVPTPAQLLGIPASGTNTMVSASRASGGASAPAKKGAANARHATNHRFILGLLSSGPSEDPGGCSGEKQGERDEAGDPVQVRRALQAVRLTRPERVARHETEC